MPELLPLGKREGKAYLAIPSIERNCIGEKAVQRTKEIQAKWNGLLGKSVVDFWLKHTQLQLMSLVRKGRAEAMRRDGQHCRLCAYVEQKGMTSLEHGVPFNQSLRSAHLTRRVDSFWRILDEHFGQMPDPRVIFTEDGVALFKSELKSDAKHSGANYLVCLCKHHDNAVQQVLYPTTRAEQSADDVG